MLIEKDGHWLEASAATHLPKSHGCLLKKSL